MSVDGSTGHREVPVPVASGAGPHPTSVAHLDLRPEAGRDGYTNLACHSIMVPPAILMYEGD